MSIESPLKRFYLNRTSSELNSHCQNYGLGKNVIMQTEQYKTTSFFVYKKYNKFLSHTISVINICGWHRTYKKKIQKVCTPNTIQGLSIKYRDWLKKGYSQFKANLFFISFNVFSIGSHINPFLFSNGRRRDNCFNSCDIFFLTVSND